MNPSWEREYLRKDHDLILKLFGGRCLVCGRPTNIVHEIVPISHGKKYLAIKNRCPLCLFHHDWAHIATKTSIIELQELREKYIVTMLLHRARLKYPRFMESQI